LLSVAIVAQPLLGVGLANAPDSSLIARADSFAPLGDSLQSVRPDAQQSLVFCPPKRVFLYISRAPRATAKDGRPFENSETINYARPLDSFYSGRSPPSKLS
jgi:hypothetical protein